MNRKFIFVLVLLLVSTLLIGCNPFQVTTIDGTAQPTAVVELTLVPEDVTAVATEVTSAPTATVTAGVTEQATAVSDVTPATAESCVDAAEFVADISVPDNSQFEPDTDFTKIWRIKNIGTCTWDSGYELYQLTGNLMGAASTSFPFPATVAPGEILNLSVELVSPTEPGTYQSDWMFQNPQGLSFGVGPNVNIPVWVIIVVKEPQPVNQGSISGFAWQDQDFDNQVEAGEMLVGVSITLSEGANCGAVVQTIHTDINGRFTFHNLLPGSYCLSGTDGEVTVSQSGYVLFENQQISEVNVTWPPVWPDPAAITGWVWDDFSADGMIQPDEAYISGVTVLLYSGSCVGDAITAQLQTVTDSEGKYSFDGLQPGTYCLFIDAGGPANAAVLQSGDWTFPDFGVGFHEITVLAGELVTPVNFGWDYN